MRRRMLFVALAVAAMLVLPGGAGASHDPSGAPFGEDFVTGSYGRESAPPFWAVFHSHL